MDAPPGSIPRDLVHHTRELLRAHDAALRVRPAEEEAWAIRSTAHGIISRPEARAAHDRQVRDGRVRHCVDKQGARLDDSRL